MAAQIDEHQVPPDQTAVMKKNARRIVRKNHVPFVQGRLVPPYPLLAYQSLFLKVPCDATRAIVQRRCVKMGTEPGSGGYIYVFIDEMRPNAFVKIGGTARSVAARIKEWSYLLQTQIGLLFYFYTPSWRDVEIIIHAALQPRRMHNVVLTATNAKLTELFQLTTADHVALRHFVQSVCRYAAAASGGLLV